MFKRLVLASILLGWVASACGLRGDPESPDGGSGTAGKGGTGGSVLAGTGGHGGGAGSVVGGRGGTGGSVLAGSGGRGGTGDTGGTGGVGGVGGSTGGGTGGMIVGSGGAGGSCTPGGGCEPANPCHIGKTICSTSGMPSCTDTGTAQANGIACGTNMVCNNGACAACTAGAACTSTNVCKIGAISCATGVAVCTDTADKANGTSCGTGMVCQTGRCVACEANAACTPTNPCHQGALACSTGTPTCTDKGTNVAAGTSCGTNMVCSSTAACVACQAGMACSVSGKPCRTAAIVCSSGAPVCTETGNVANGTSCGTNLVCATGVCTSCTAGMACTPANPCHAGTQTCNPIACTDTTRNLANGTSCGTNMVCNNGTCGICNMSAVCQPSNVCKTGATSCVTGVPVCADTGNKANGTSCGTNMVCNNGACGSCVQNNSCTGNPGVCKAGTTSCSSGVMTCVDGGNKSAGASCGTNQVCNGNGICVACTAGNSCTGNPTSCKNGTTACTTGAMTCIDGSNKAAGTGCGSNMVCNGSGVCVACTAGNTCTGNPSACKNGTTSCTTGAMKCVDGSTNKAAGTSCGTNLVCDGMGTCGACTASQSCTDNPNPCFTGITSCTTGTMVCNNNTMRAAGTSCGTNMVCNSTGGCIDCTANLPCTTNPGHLCKDGVTSCTTGAMTCVDGANKTAGTGCGAAQSCMNDKLTSADMCDGAGNCTNTITDCPPSTSCNAAGTACVDNGGGPGPNLAAPAKRAPAKRP